MSVRDSFFCRLYKMIQAGEDIYILSSDLGAPSLDDLRKYYPERFINVGIAEQSLIGIAAGLIETGKKVVAYGLNPFPMTRAYDQVRCLMGELKIPVVLCALNSGICSAAAGYTHMATEVFAMARMIPNIKIYTPTDDVMAELLAEKVINNSAPSYILFDKIAGDKIYDKPNIFFEKGYSVYRPSKSYGIGIVGNSSHIKSLRKIAEDFAANNIPVTVFDIFSVPVNEDSFFGELNNCQSVITVEENILQGGLGSYILEIMSERNFYIPIKRLGIDFSNGVPEVFMDRNYLQKLYGIDELSIIVAVNNFYGKIGEFKYET